MTATSVTIRTLTPISSPIDIGIGVNPLSDAFRQPMLQAGLSSGNNAATDKPLLYQTLTDDETNLELFTWQADDQDVVLHVFPNRLAIAEIKLNISLSEANIEDTVQQLTRQQLAEVWPDFLSFIQNKISHPAALKLTIDSDISAQSIQTQWVARALELTRAELADTTVATFVRSWLSSTQDPQDAERIIRGEQSYSMTWLNYVIVDDKAVQARALIDSMILCQYIYTAQDAVNQQMATAIEQAYTDKYISEVEKKLSAARVNASMQLITYHEQMKYLTRFKRKIMDDVLQGWDFDNLVENCQRMIDVCSNRLMEVDNRRRERSTALTDAILVSLSFIAMFELSMSLIQFSREMMSSPALDYNDESASTILSFIADFDTDFVIGFGIALTVSLYFLYHKLKAR